MGKVILVASSHGMLCCEKVWVWFLQHDTLGVVENEECIGRDRLFLIEEQ
ncbi:hypothetical protein QTG56_10865 [Rossellomorea sp. AcN35-11]|nr:hypothetical protein [Rossellomorea aquimaris]NMH67903.1 hypothetical protein [Bacillus sp. RO3]WJV31378.1 hypothetical protein QTG56_10865 [Rossellomorea sp. AcN35-11]